MKFFDYAFSFVFAALSLVSIVQNDPLSEYGLLLVLSTVFRIAAAKK